MAAVLLGVSTPSTADATSYASGSFTPAADDLLVVFVLATDTVAAGSMSDSQGLGWTKIASGLAFETFDTIYAFVANALAAASPMTVTFDCTGDAATGAEIHVLRVSGMTKTGAAAVRQNKYANFGSGVTPAATFDSAALTDNPTVGGVGNASNPATLTPPADWIERADTGHATPIAGLESVSRDSGFTGTTITWGSVSGDGGVIIAELDASAGAGATSPPNALTGLSGVSAGGQINEGGW